MKNVICVWNLVTAHNKMDLLSKIIKRSVENIGRVALLLTLSERDEV